MFLKQFQQIIIVFAICSLVLLALFIISPDLVSLQKQIELKTLKNIKTKPTLTQKLKTLLKCRDNELKFEKLQYGDYWLVRNLFIGRKSRRMKCSESITYAANGDYTFLESLPVVVSRWLAPISFALYTPGYDVKKTIESIQYLRNCIPEKNLIQDYISFHIYFPNKHMPKYIPLYEDEALTWYYNCTESPPFINVTRDDLYKTKANLTYPINVGRNIARKSSNTYFIFTCDIELVPSPKLPQMFLEMVAKNISIIHGNHGLRVFALPVFEVESTAEIPSTKKQLKEMLAKGTAIPFHSKICKSCHLVPNNTLWLNSTNTKEMTITASSKRIKKFVYWEPFYISDNREPYFDERVTWEGQSNKRIQNFAMCLMGYEYHVIHPAFLTHMPGIKYFQKSRTAQVPAMNNLIKSKIEPEYRILYGNNRLCKT